MKGKEICNIVWKEIPGSNGMYEASTSGFIRNANGRILKMYVNAKGRCLVGIKLNGKTTIMLVYRLVALTFLPNPDNKPQVNHIDGDKGNNNLTNLEWSTPTENMRHAVKHGLVKGMFKKGVANSYGEKHPYSKLSEAQVKNIRESRLSGSKTNTELSKIYNVSYSCINRVVNNKRWTHL